MNQLPELRLSAPATTGTNNLVDNLDFTRLVKAYCQARQWEDTARNWRFERLTPDVGLLGRLLGVKEARCKCPVCGSPARRYLVKVKHRDGGSERLLTRQPAGRGEAHPCFFLCGSGHVAARIVWLASGDFNKSETHVLTPDGTFRLDQTDLHPTGY